MAEKKEKEDPEFLLFWPPDSVKTPVRRKGTVGKAEQEEAGQLVETDKREEQEGGGDSIVFVCLH